MELKGCQCKPEVSDSPNHMCHDSGMNPIVEHLAGFGGGVRYVAVLERGSEPDIWEREPGPDSSASESDRYEELLVNPALLNLAGNRGDLDCGGLDYLLVRYGNFFQLVVPTPTGHVSVCLSPDTDVQRLTQRVLAALATQTG